jgi:hypothetical protein
VVCCRSCFGDKARHLQEENDPNRQHQRRNEWAIASPSTTWAANMTPANPLKKNKNGRINAFSVIVPLSRAWPSTVFTGYARIEGIAPVKDSAQIVTIVRHNALEPSEKF